MAKEEINLNSPETHDSFESTANALWHAESLQDVIRRGVLMANFRVATHGEDIWVHFADEVHRYPKPDDSAIERIVAAFAPPPAETPDIDIRLDEAAMDG